MIQERVSRPDKQRQREFVNVWRAPIHAWYQVGGKAFILGQHGLQSSTIFRALIRLEGTSLKRHKNTIKQKITYQELNSLGSGYLTLLSKRSVPKTLSLSPVGIAESISRHIFLGRGLGWSGVGMDRKLAAPDEESGRTETT